MHNTFDPVYRLGHLAEAFGNFPVVIDQDFDPEFDDLAREFNELRLQLND